MAAESQLFMHIARIFMYPLGTLLQPGKKLLPAAVRVLLPDRIFTFKSGQMVRGLILHLI